MLSSNNIWIERIYVFSASIKSTVRNFCARLHKYIFVKFRHTGKYLWCLRAQSKNIGKPNIHNVKRKLAFKGWKFNFQSKKVFRKVKTELNPLVRRMEYNVVCTRVLYVPHNKLLSSWGKISSGIDRSDTLTWPNMSSCKTR